MLAWRGGLGWTVCVTLLVLALVFGCISSAQQEGPTREESLPPDAVKIAAEEDVFPPVGHSDLWDQPVGLGAPVNTAGAEDSPFITRDGDTLYFFFTPDVRKTPQEQLLDGVTGIWVSTRVGGNWSEPERVVLSKKPSLDGCVFVSGKVMWFCSARAGNYRDVDLYTAEWKDGEWRNWRNAGRQLNLDYWAGEVHLTPDLQTIYFHSNRSGGYGGLDIWRCRRQGNTWGEPENMGPRINSERDESLPFVTPDAEEIWFTGPSVRGFAGPAIFRSKRDGDGNWGEPEEIFSNFAGEPCLDSEGNVYFVHHFFDREGRMIEADIYIARRRGR